MNDYLNIIHSKEELTKCREFINSCYLSCGLDKNEFVERHDYRIDNKLDVEKDVHFIAEQYFIQNSSLS